jgi:hypothetical protein
MYQHSLGAILGEAEGAIPKINFRGSRGGARKIG